tara:strand:+ start:270 stop:461 length:192 start_codon:yes stop_codon:yes gene_type:complete
VTVEEMNQALQVLVNAINIAQKRGAYSLEESAAIFAAIQSFNKKEEAATEGNVDETPTQLEET